MRLLPAYSCLAVALSLMILPATSWADSLETALMPGRVIQGHAKWEEYCAKCHKRFDKAAQPQLCQDCHKDIRKDAQEKRGLHGRFKDQKECRECHTEHKGRMENIAPISEQTFSHERTDFPLVGAHADRGKVECKACHKPKAKYRDAPSDCYACHKKDDKHKGALGSVCGDCHTERNWKDTASKFNHETTRFPLRGKHARTKCEDCHAGERYKSTPMDCYSCHKKDDHHKGVFGPKCELCHQERNWKTSTFDHDKDTTYRLKGRHAKVKCDSCHRKPVASEKTPTVCYACHKKDDKHKRRYGERCEICHTERNWNASIFDHDRDTKYSLKGKHRRATCDSCHKGRLYKDKTPTMCYACHQKDDKHKGRFGERCESCHIETDWKTLIFDHDRATRYPLLGKHRPLACDSCHKGHLYRDKLKTTCYACHEKDDKHKGQEGSQCEECHNERSWKETRFDHGLTKFPLLGKHAKTECKKCHLTPAFKDAESDCVACHEKEDVHKRRLGTGCEKCHNARDWKIWDFDHDVRTRFKLDGGHAGLSCYSCHKSSMGKTVRASGACESCHRKDDKHEGGFGPQCERCHETASWKTIKRGAGKLSR